VNGFLFQQGNSSSLIAILDEWVKLPEIEKSEFRRQARITYEQHYTPEANYKMLMSIYQNILDKL
ncbi:glycosyltransferase, partial [Escherichia coli]|uniref:glycosyltransferase n=1 Tax=Escherichia coli TaxID=562 RepID=UPI001BDDADEE